MTMAYHEVPPDVLESAAELTDWARRALQLAEKISRRPASHKTKKKRDA
jgi:TfoX/Sxy family transcriptional regulator of competence genes